MDFFTVEMVGGVFGLMYMVDVRIGRIGWMDELDLHTLSEQKIIESVYKIRY